MTNFRQTTSQQQQQHHGAERKSQAANTRPLIPQAALRQQADDSNDRRHSPQQATTSGWMRPPPLLSPSSSNLSSRRSSPSETPTATTNMMNNRKGQLPPPAEGEVWSSVEDLLWDHLEEVQNKWDTLKLNDDIWAKLIYFEQNRRLAKAYVSAPVLTIDGSTNGLDGFRIGLSGIDNRYRNLDSVGCLRSIGQGVKLKIDSQGNILIRKISSSSSSSQQNNATSGGHSSKCSVWIRDWPSQQSSTQSFTKKSTASNGKSVHGLDIDGENCTMREVEQSDTSYKLFDMRRFRHYLERRRLSNMGANKLDWRQCVSIISFVRRHQQQAATATKPGEILEEPCWIMLINIIAIDMIKSIICDDNNRLASADGQIKSSTLAHQHSLMNGNINQRTSQEQPAGRARTLKSSSSTSVLYQPALAADLSLNEVTTSGVGVPANNRVKKPRTAQNLRGAAGGRPSSLVRGENLPSSQHRRYQSSQQLANNSNSNIIYTTFNSKFINYSNQSSSRASREHTNYHSSGGGGDLSTTASDYYSGSRSSTNGFANSRNGVYSSSSVQDGGSGYARSTRFSQQAALPRAPFARGQFVRQLENNRSQSSFDLSGFNFKPIQSAIKMNYDHFSEAEDFYEQEDMDKGGGGSYRVDNGVVRDKFTSEIEANMRNLAAAAAAAASSSSSSGEKTVNSNEASIEDSSFVASSCEQDLTTTKNREDSSPSFVVNHNECQAMHNSVTGSTTDTTPPIIQKMSRSSLTSSSSSGCADNDYFMSHSSSSVSSSTASNERELSSQPASSSGIACSGNTSDEYDDNRKQAEINSPVGGTECPLARLHHHGGQKLKKEGETKVNRRGYKIKLIEPEAAADYLDESQDCGIVCDCEPVAAGYDCDCCCDCLIQDHHHAPSEPLECSCDCDTGSIYDCLPAPPKSIASSRNKPGVNRRRRLTEDDKNGSMTRLDDDDDTFMQKSSSPARSNQSSEKEGNRIRESTKSPSWLEKRKYSRIFPKFIFASSNSSSRKIATSDDKTTAGNNDNTQRKNQSLARAEKFRLTRSTQDLS